MFATKIRVKPGMLSAASFGRGMDNMTEWLAVLISAITRNMGILALLVADSVAGGMVINDTLSHGRMWVTVLATCWSIATASILMSLLEAMFSGGLRKTRLAPTLFAVVVILIDGFIDIKIVTLLMYPELTEMPRFAPPNASPMWLPLTILAGLLTTFGEFGIVFIRARRKQVMIDEAKAHDEALEIVAPAN